MPHELSARVQDLSMSLVSGYHTLLEPFGDVSRYHLNVYYLEKALVLVCLSLSNERQSDGNSMIVT